MSGKNVHQVCPVEQAGALDSKLRRALQNPTRIVSPFIKAGMRVLDFGCGPGYFTLPMANLVGPSGQVVAADLQQGMLNKLAARLRHEEYSNRVDLHLTQSKSSGLQGQFDFILACYVLHEVPSISLWFDEMRSLLSAKGTILVLEPPIRVSRKEFAETMRRGADSGLVCVDRPSVFFALTALFAKTN